VSDDNKKVVSSDQCSKGNYTLEATCRNAPCALPGDLHCNFDQRKFCGWINIQSDNFDWTIAKRTPSLNTGPQTDHTTRRGYFAYIEASRPRRRHDKAQLTSLFLNVTRGCIEFSYHMRGISLGSLNVYISTKRGNRILFTKKGYQGSVWMKAKIDVDEIKAREGYRIIIEATVGYGVYGDIAIDDISFNDKACSQVQTVPKNCREISPYCNHKSRQQYCKESRAYRDLCCRTCANLLSQ